MKYIVDIKGEIDGDYDILCKYGECKTCKHYRPYDSRRDGYCAVSRNTPEGMTTINVNEDFGCTYYQKGN